MDWSGESKDAPSRASFRLVGEECLELTLEVLNLELKQANLLGDAGGGGGRNGSEHLAGVRNDGSGSRSRSSTLSRLSGSSCGCEAGPTAPRADVACWRAHVVPRWPGEDGSRCGRERREITMEVLALTIPPSVLARADEVIK